MQTPRPHMTGDARQRCFPPQHRFKRHMICGLPTMGSYVNRSRGVSSAPRTSRMRRARSTATPGRG